MQPVAKSGSEKCGAKGQFRFRVLSPNAGHHPTALLRSRELHVSMVVAPEDASGRSRTRCETPSPDNSWLPLCYVMGKVSEEAV